MARRPSTLSVQRPRAPFRTRSPHARRYPRRRAGFWLWLALVAGGGFAGTLAALQMSAPPPVIAGPAGLDRPATRMGPAASDALEARFTLCHSGGGRDCVVDGDTFWFAGEKYRIADIDAPETHPPRCAEEAALGAAATDRLHDWLNDGAFSLENTDRDTDRYGRKLRVVTRGGHSVGSVLVDEGLARRWEGRRRPWC